MLGGKLKMTDILRDKIKQTYKILTPLACSFAGVIW